MIHNDPPSVSETPLQSNLITLISQNDSERKKKANQLRLRKSKSSISLPSFGRSKPKMYEDKVLQPAFARHMDKLMAEHGTFMWHHCPNGGKRSIGVGKQLKAQGTKKGVPDNHVLYGNGKTLYIEIKDIDGKLSPEQKAWISMATDFGHKCYVIVCKHPVDVEQKTNAILRDNGVVV